ncbi:MAG TPA: DUF4442 domain-containing protein [Flavobacteriales bacterium]|nr:DUF4442 domain-containing protein [Flavobacteriales bacterium]HIN42236.1 DUF4442 domain-containing protein [Flavobacteriales bacterium]HIO59523.1 DUF4442 domain-containing protein [Flavobacteriales bacterium]
MENFSMRFMAKALIRAKTGKPGRFSRIMQEVIPFNRPHRISISEITSEGCVVHLPYRRRNLNHLGTMHACAMATAGEYVSGLNVIEAFDISKYRLIMSRLEVDYLRRPVGECNASSRWPEGVLTSIQSSLSSEGVATFTMTSELVDSDSVHVATTTTHWQVKSWDKVRVRS